MYSKLLILVVLIALSGCGVTRSKTDFNLTSQEKQAIEEEKLIKPELLSTTDVDTIKVKKSDKAFICARIDMRQNTCYQHIGERAAEYFEKKGIPTTNNKSEATRFITLALGFGYAPTYDSNKIVMESADASLAADNTFDHIKLNADEDAEMKKDSILGNLGAAAVALALGATGQHAAYAALTNPSASYNGKNETRQEIIATLNDGDGMHQVKVQYHGPADPAKTFPVLFDEAMKEAASKVVIN